MPSKLATSLKMLAAGAICCIGGPYLVIWVSPTDEELFKKYSPELQKKSLERRFERQKEFDDFVNQLKIYSKSDKPIWLAQEEGERKKREELLRKDYLDAQDAKLRKEAMRRESGLFQDSATLTPSNMNPKNS